MARISKSLIEREKDQILRSLALNGWLRIPEIAEKTGIEAERVLEAIWGKVNAAGLSIQSDENPYPLIHWLNNPVNDSKWPPYLRSYGLSFAGAYWALKKFPESFGLIMEKWVAVHQFIFQRYTLFKKHGLEGALIEFIHTLDPINFRLDQAAQVEDIEEGWIVFVPRKKGGLISNWFDLIQEDSQFRERIKTFYHDSTAHFKSRIIDYEHALKTMDNLGSRKPDKEQLQYDMSFFIGRL